MGADTQRFLRKLTSSARAERVQAMQMLCSRRDALRPQLIAALEVGTAYASRVDPDTDRLVWRSPAPEQLVEGLLLLADVVDVAAAQTVTDATIYGQGWADQEPRVLDGDDLQYGSSVLGWVAIPVPTDRAISAVYCHVEDYQHIAAAQHLLEAGGWQLMPQWRNDVLSYLFGTHIIPGDFGSEYGGYNSATMHCAILAQPSSEGAKKLETVIADWYRPIAEQHQDEYEAEIRAYQDAEAANAEALAAVWEDHQNSWRAACDERHLQLARALYPNSDFSLLQLTEADRAVLSPPRRRVTETGVARDFPYPIAGRMHHAMLQRYEKPEDRWQELRRLAEHSVRYAAMVLLCVCKECGLGIPRACQSLLKAPRAPDWGQCQQMLAHALTLLADAGGAGERPILRLVHAKDTITRRSDDLRSLRNRADAHAYHSPAELPRYHNEQRTSTTLTLVLDLLTDMAEIASLTLATGYSARNDGAHPDYVVREFRGSNL